MRLAAIGHCVKIRNLFTLMINKYLAKTVVHIKSTR